MFCNKTFAAIVLFISAAGCSLAQAATLYHAGGGNWDTVTLNWGTAPGGPYTSPWADGSDAVFEGGGGAVTVGAVSPTSITFNGNGYSLTTGTITLNSANTPVNVGSGFTASISATTAGAGGILKSGLGSLNFNGTAVSYTFAGGLAISQGTVTVDGNTIGATLTNLGSAAITLGDTNTAANAIAFRIVNGGGDVTIANDITVTNNGSGTVTLAGDGGVRPTFNGVVSINRATTVITSSSDRLTFLGKVTGSAGTLTIKGSGGSPRTCFTNASNDFTGNILVQDANNVFQSQSAGQQTVPNNSSVDVAAGAIFQLADAGAEAIDALTGSGTIRHFPISATSTLVVGSNNGSGSFSGQIRNSINENAASGVIAFQKTGTGAQILSGPHLYIGGVTLSDGTLTIDNTQSLGSGSYGLVSPPKLTVNSGLLRWTGAAGTNFPLGELSGTGGTLANGAAGALTWTVGSMNTSTTFSGVIANNDGTPGATTSLTKVGTGSLAIPGTHTYTGSTAINAGKLLGGTGGSLATSGTTVASGGGIGVRATTAGAPPFVWNNITFGGVPNMDFDFNTVAPSTTTAPMTVAGNLPMDSSAQFAASGSNMSIGSFPLVTYTGSLTGAGTLPATISINPPLFAATLTHNPATKTIYLNVTRILANLKWAVGDGIWDIGTTPNFNDGNGAVPYQEVGLPGDNVTFDQTFGGLMRTVTLNQTVSPASVTVITNSNNDYTISGTGQITGSASLTKHGSGNLNLLTSNTYTGGTTMSNAINAGRIFVGADNALGTGPLIVLGGGNALRTTGLTPGIVTLPNNISLANGLDIFSPGGLALNGNISGAGSIKNGSGDLIFGGDNSGFTGSIDYNNNTDRGNLFLTSANSGSAAATWTMTGIVTSSLALAWQGSGNGTVKLGSLQGTGRVSNSSPGTTATFVVGALNTSPNYGGLIQDGPNGAKVALVKTGTGTLTLNPNAANSPPNSYSGGTVLSKGTLTYDSNALQSTPFGSGRIVLGDPDTAANNILLRVLRSTDVPNDILVSASATGTVTLQPEPTNNFNNAVFSGTLTLNRDLIINTPNIGSNCRSMFTGKITGACNTLTVAGNGRTQFTNSNNDWTGNLNVTSSGGLFTEGESVPDTANVTVSGNFWISGPDGMVETIGGLNGAGSVYVYYPGNPTGVPNALAGSHTLVVGANNANGSFGGTFKDAAQDKLILKKIGNGRQDITSGSGIPSGSFLITQGTLGISNNGALSPAPVTMTGGTILWFGAANGTPTMGDLSGSAGVIASSTVGTSTFRIGGTGSTTFSGTIVNSDVGTPGVITALQKSGTGTQALSGANTYTGATTVLQGKLVGVTGGSLQSATTVNAGAFTFGVRLASANGQFSIPSLTFVASAASALEFDFTNAAPSTTTAPLSISGAFTGGGNQIKIVCSNLQPGTYPLATYGSFAGTLGTLVLPPHVTGTLNNAGGVLSLTVTNGFRQPLTWAVGDQNWDIGTALSNWKDGAGNPGQFYVEGDSVLFDDTSSGTSPVTVTINQASVSPNGIEFNAAKDYILAGAAGRIIAGTGGITKRGSGVATLANPTANTFTGATNILGGTLSISLDTQLGGTTNSLFLNGGALRTTTSLALNQTRNIYIGTENGIGTGILDVASGTTLSYAGTILNNTGATGKFVKTGLGQFTITGSNLATGGTTISQGTLLINPVPNASNTFHTFNGPITLGDSNTGSNNVDVQFGTNINSTSFDAYVRANPGQTAQSLAIRRFGPITVSASGTGSAAITANNQPSLTNTAVISADTFMNRATTLKGTGVLMGVFSGPGGGAGNDTLIHDNGANTLSLFAKDDGVNSYANTFVGNVHIKTGVFQTNNHSYIANVIGNQNLVIPDSSSVIVDAGSTWQIAYGVETIDALIGAGTVRNLFGSGAASTSFYLANTPTLMIGMAGGSGIFSGTMVDNGAAFSFAKIGSGIQTLSGANTYSGLTTISGGILRYGLATAIPSGTGKGNVQLNNPGTLDLNGFSPTVNGLLGTGTVTTTNATAATLNVGQTGTSSVFDGLLQNGAGTVALAKIGNGIFTLTGANTYSGGTSVTGGSLQVSNSAGSATGSGDVAIGLNSILTGNGIISGNVSITSGLLNPGLATGNGLGKLTTGSLTINSGITNFQLLSTDGGAANVGGDDEVLVNGDLVMAGTLNLTITNVSVGVYHLFTFTGTASGSFSTINGPAGYTASVFVSGNNVNVSLDHAPTLAPISNVTVNESALISFTANGADVDAGQTLTYSISAPVPAGATINPVSGAFSWTPTDGPAQSQTVTIRVTDNAAFPIFAEQSFSVTVSNVAPTATFANGGAVNEGSTGAVSFTGQADVSTQDATAGFRYSFDFNNDGNFETGGNDYASALTTANVTVPASFLDDNPSSTIRGRIWDKDGGFTDYTTTIVVNNVTPTAALVNSGDVTEGTLSATVSFTNIVEPSTADAAVLHYAYDLDNNNNFDIGGDDYLTSVTTTSVTIPTAFLNDGPRSIVVRARVYDKDGAFSEYTTTINVSNVAPVAVMGPIPDTTEGGTTSFTMSSQFDPSGPDTTAGFRYSYDFNYAGGVPAFDLGGNSFATASFISNPTIPASQILNGPSTQTVLARVFDKDGGFTDYTATFNIANAAPALLNMNATTAVENSTTTLTGTLADTGVLDDFALVIDWQDGTIESFDLDPSAAGSQNFSYSHTYLDDNPTNTNFDIYAVSVSVIDNDNAGDSVLAQARVNNANPVVSIPNGLAPRILEHATTGLITLATFTDVGTLDTHSVTINWGDSTPLDTSATLIEPAGATPGSILANHLFDDGPGTRTVTVTVTDDDNGSTSAAFTVIVDNVAPTAIFQRPDAGSHAQMTAVEFVNQLDPSDADTAIGFLYSYDFNNDGIFEISLSQSANATIPPQYLASHPNHIVRGRITDKDGGFSDYFLQQPFFASNPIFVEFDLGAQSSYTLVATSAPAPVYTIEVVDLPDGVANLAALGLSFDGVATISGVPFIGGLITLRATATNFAGAETVDLIIKIKRPVNSNHPKIISEAVANPNPCIAGTPVTFSVVAIDTDGDVLSYYWDFADGSSARGRVVTHTYTSPGKYVVSVSISDGKNDDTFDHLNLVVAAGSENTFDVQQAKLSFDFRKPERSTLYVTGFIPMPSGPLAGTTAEVHINGTTYAQVFQFDSKGNAGDAMSLLSLKTIQTGTGTSRAKFVFSLKSTNGQDPLHPSLFQMIGLLFPATTLKSGEQVPVPLVVTIGSQAAQTNTIPLLYKVVPNRTGKGQYKRK